MNDSQLTNRKIGEKLRKSPDESSLDEDIKLLLLKNEIEMRKKSPDKPW
jgi:hypothetical protein